jgi:hypothetical protein
MKSCAQCEKEFEITDGDRAFYGKIDVPEPTRCPDCRNQRRLCFRNERTLYARKCDKTGKDIISFYAPNAPVVVYEQIVWLGDSWDPMEYGRDFDFARPFFEQCAELQHVVPHFSLHKVNPVNSEYVNLAANNKNCYMCFSSIDTEDCMYCAFIDESRDCIDCIYTIDQSELCYYAVGCSRCYRSLYIQNCSGLTDSYFCYNCSNCDHCFGCVNLRNVSYRWFNESISPEEYQKRLEHVNVGMYSSVQEMKKKFTDFVKTFPHKYAQIINSEKSTGNYLENAKNCFSCFDAHDAEDCAYMIRAYSIKDCYDSHGIPGPCELVYESISSGYSSNTRFCIMCNFDNDLQYCIQCCNSQELFGCVGLKKKQNCILNKQYAKAEYESLVGKIVNHMKETGEYGEFFPISMSPFGYNETVAPEMYPLAREQALEKGCRWQDELQATRGKGTMPPDKIPDDIVDVSDDISQQILACERCRKNYKIIKQEISFYKKLSIPIPRFCHDCRYKEHIALRPPRTLFDGRCMCTHAEHGHRAVASAKADDLRCPVTFQTPYSPEAQRIIYCEQCYQKEVV